MTNKRWIPTLGNNRLAPVLGWKDMKSDMLPLERSWKRSPLFWSQHKKRRNLRKRIVGYSIITVTISILEKEIVGRDGKGHDDYTEGILVWNKEDKKEQNDGKLPSSCALYYAQPTRDKRPPMSKNSRHDEIIFWSSRKHKWQKMKGHEN